jgi:hypothetical protein
MSCTVTYILGLWPSAQNSSCFSLILSALFSVTLLLFLFVLFLFWLCLFSMFHFSCSYGISFHDPFLFSFPVPLFNVPHFSVPHYSVPGFPCSAHPRLLPKEMAEHLSATQESPHPLHILILGIRNWAAFNRRLASLIWIWPTRK